MKNIKVEYILKEKITLWEREAEGLEYLIKVKTQNKNVSNEEIDHLCDQISTVEELILCLHHIEEQNN